MHNTLYGKNAAQAAYIKNQQADICITFNMFSHVWQKYSIQNKWLCEALIPGYLFNAKCVDETKGHLFLLRLLL